MEVSSIPWLLLGLFEGYSDAYQLVTTILSEAMSHLSCHCRHPRIEVPKLVKWYEDHRRRRRYCRHGNFLGSGRWEIWGWLEDFVEILVRNSN